MKKLVLAMACVLSLGLLASCKNGVQDVNVKNANDTALFSNVGKTTFTATKQTVSGTATPYTWADATGVTVSESAYKYASSIQATKDQEAVTSNIEKKWTLKIAYKTTLTGATTSSEAVATVNIYKIGSNYYADDAFESAATGTGVATKESAVKFTEGDPESDTFTIESLGVVGGIKFSNIKFTKKSREEISFPCIMELV
jgi:hypothetical protein